MTFSVKKGYFRLAFLAPVAVALLIPLTLVITYVWAAYVNEDVMKYLPYISETYDDPPQAIWYTHMFDVIVIMMILSCVLRYIQLDTILSHEPCTTSLKFDCRQVNRLKLVNKLGLVFSLLMCLATLLLSSARISENYIYHYVLAFIVFLSGPFMFALQAWISFKFRPTLTTTLMAYTRLLIAIVSMGDIMVFLVARLMARSRENKEHVDTWHVVAAHAEYVFVLLISPFAFTYVSELRRLKCVKSAEFVYRFDDIIHTRRDVEEVYRQRH